MSAATSTMNASELAALTEALKKLGCPQGKALDMAEGAPILGSDARITGTNSYECACVEGWTGDNCDTDVDDCDPDPCALEIG